MKATYKLSIQTSDVREAGTDAQIHVNMKGENGESGQVVLKSGKKMFERASLEVRHINCNDLGELKSLMIVTTKINFCDLE